MAEPPRQGCAGGESPRSPLSHSLTIFKVRPYVCAARRMAIAGVFRWVGRVGAGWVVGRSWLGHNQGMENRTQKRGRVYCLAHRLPYAGRRCPKCVERRVNGREVVMEIRRQLEAAYGPQRWRVAL